MLSENRTRNEIDDAISHILERESVGIATQAICACPSSPKMRWVEVLMRPKFRARMFDPWAFTMRSIEQGNGPALDLMILRQALSWLSGEFNLQLCSVNISTKSASQPGFANKIIKLIAAQRIESSKVCIELMEGGSRVKLSELAGFIEALHDAGVKVALDNFGANQTSATVLKKLKLDYLKIDRCYISPLPFSRAEQSIVRGIVGLANNLGIRTIAEHVETEEHRIWVARLGVDYYQGFVDQGAPKLPHEDIPGQLYINDNIITQFG